MTQKQKILAMLTRKGGATVRQMFAVANGPSCRMTELARDGYCIHSEWVTVGRKKRQVKRYFVKGARRG